MRFLNILFLLTTFIIADELESIIKDENNDSVLVEKLIILSKNTDNKVIAFKSARKAKESSEASSVQQKVKAIINLADINTKYLQFEDAINVLFELYTLAEMENDPKLAVIFYKNIGDIYLKMNNYSQATEYFVLGLKYSEDQKFDSDKSFFAQNLAKLNYELKNYRKSIEYYKSSLEIGIELEDYNVIAEAKLGLGRAYFNLQELKKSEENLLSAVQLASHFKNNNRRALSYNYLAKVYESEEKKDTAKKYFLQASDLINKSFPNDVASEVYVDLGRFYQNQGDTKSAIKNLENGYVIANKLGNLYLKKKSSEALASLYESSGNFEKSNKYLKINKQVIDKIFEVGKQKNISEALVEYETGNIEKKNLELETRLLNQEAEKQKIENQSLRNLLILTILLSIMVLISFVIYYRYRTKNKANKILQNKNLEIESLNSQLILRNNEIQKINNDLTSSEKKLKNSNASKDKFFSIIAHDLKNPISGLLLATDLIITYYNDLTRDQIVEKIKELNQTSKNLRSLLENLLEWARTQTNSIEYEPESLSITKVINNVINLFNSNITQKNLKVKIDIQETNVFADPKMIETIIRNIVSNSIKFTPNGGEIKIYGKTDNNFLRFTFEDNGLGIPKDKIDEIFEVTSTFSTLGTNKEKGTGLGLTLCKEFIEINKGSISVESVYGEYTKFDLKVPLSNE